MDLSNKRAVFLGDSITEGAGVAGDKLYHSILKEKLGLAAAVNCGIGGTRIAKQSADSTVEPVGGDFVARARELPDCDCVFVFGGTNDFGHGDAPFGTPEDNSADTFCGACNALMEYLCGRYGAENVIAVLPLHRLGENNVYGDGSKKSPSRALKDYVGALGAACKKYGVHVVCLWDCPQLNPNIKGNEVYFIDGLHPNAEGHRLLAEKIAEAVRAF